MRYFEITGQTVEQLIESTSLTSTVTTIQTILGNIAASLYRDMRQRAEQAIANGNEARSVYFQLGSVKSRWFAQFGMDLRLELGHLAKQVPGKSAIELQKFLLKHPDKYSELLPVGPILVRLGQKIGNDRLSNTAKLWIDQERSFQNWLSDMLDQGEEEVTVAPVAPKPNKNDTPPTRNVERDKMRGAQNQQVDQVINATLAQLPNEVRHPIRMAVQKSANKLQTLQAELQKRGLA